MLALKSILANKMRALLTMLGIIIGVAAVILIVGLGNGVTNKVEDTFKEMGSNIIVATAYAQDSTKHIKIDSVEELVENDSNITVYSPYVPATLSVKAGKEEKRFSVDGVNSQYIPLRSKKLEIGRGIEYIDEKRFQKVCVLGYHTMTDLFGKDADPNEVVNQIVKIGGTKYRIIGVLKEISKSQFSDEDNMILIPYTVAQREFNQKYITTWYFSYLDKESSKDATDVIDKFFLNIFNDTDKYIIIDAQSIMDNMNDTINTIKMVLVAIAGISLLVGGIGIMNIMLVSVTERTREIGIRKAIGANKKDVLRQFVIEAITTSVIGGALGIILGIMLVGSVSKAFDINGTVNIDSILIASGISAFIGIIFGYLPANKAANLHPIDALRYE
jgi:putative ABC transport system permease protein